jgi:hypothetical protein
MHAIAISMYKSDLCDRILDLDKSIQCYVDIKATLQQGMSQHKFEG